MQGRTVVVMLPTAPKKTAFPIRRGAVVVYAAVSLTLLIGLTALAIDIGYKQDRLLHTQAAADAAALSGAADLFKYWLKNAGDDPANSARASAISIAEKNGYVDGENGAIVQVAIPPVSGRFAGRKGYVEVSITQQVKRFFSRLYNPEDMVLKVRAVARASYYPINEGVVVLDLKGKDALNAHGGGNITIKGAPVVVNSNNSEAAITHGSASAQIRANEFRITGGYAQTGGSVFANVDGTQPPTIVTGRPPSADPLAYLPAPSLTDMPPGTMTKTTIPDSGGDKLFTLTPGVFSGGLSFSGKDSVTMQPGIYYMNKGGFSFNSQGSLIAKGVMIYNDTAGSSSQKISITGQGVVEMSPPTTGLYQGILVFQARESSTPIEVTGNGQFKIGGTFYAANALVKISGNGDAYIGSQYISRYLDVGGNGTLTIDATAAPHPRKRILQLVE
jgi:hypothetical protein